MRRYVPGLDLRHGGNHMSIIGGYFLGAAQGTNACCLIECTSPFSFLLYAQPALAGWVAFVCGRYKLCKSFMVMLARMQHMMPASLVPGLNIRKHKHFNLRCPHQESARLTGTLMMTKPAADRQGMMQDPPLHHGSAELQCRLPALHAETSAQKLHMKLPPS